jgi:hypothetical protein
MSSLVGLHGACTWFLDHGTAASSKEAPFGSRVISSE